MLRVMRSGDPNVTMANAERQLALYFQEKRPHIAKLLGANKLDDLSFESKARLLKKVIDYLNDDVIPGWEMQDMKYEPQQSAQDDTGQVAINCGIDSRNRRHFYLDDHRLYRQRLGESGAGGVGSSGVGGGGIGSVGNGGGGSSNGSSAGGQSSNSSHQVYEIVVGPCAEEWERFTARMTASKNENERDMGVFLQSCLLELVIDEMKQGCHLHGNEELHPVRLIRMERLHCRELRLARKEPQQQQITQPPYAPQTATDFVAPADRQQMQLPQQQQFVANSPASGYCPPESMHYLSASPPWQQQPQQPAVPPQASRSQPQQYPIPNGGPCPAYYSASHYQYPARQPPPVRVFASQMANECSRQCAASGHSMRPDQWHQAWLDRQQLSWIQDQRAQPSALHHHHPQQQQQQPPPPPSSTAGGITAEQQRKREEKIQRIMQIGQSAGLAPQQMQPPPPPPSQLHSHPPDNVSFPQYHHQYPHAVMMNHARLPPQQQPPPVPPPPTAAIAQPAAGGKRQHPYAQPTTLNTAATTSSSTPTPAAAPKPASGASKRRKKDQQQKQQQ
uniref:Trithorax group protein osa n=1 Tax=Macrostomum lignano TaxID=282301 RepID=A0A1I8GXQ9_9PLAT